MAQSVKHFGLLIANRYIYYFDDKMSEKSIKEDSRYKGSF